MADSQVLRRTEAKAFFGALPLPRRLYGLLQAQALKELKRKLKACDSLSGERSACQAHRSALTALR